MKNVTLCIICLLAAIPGMAQYQFKDEIKIECTEVTNQQRTGTCWSFATTSFLEAELIKKGMNIDLSEMFYVRKNYEEKAVNFVSRQGKTQFGEGSLAHDVVRLYERYGAIPHEAYDGHPEESDYYNHSELEKGLTGFLKGVIKNGKPSVYWSSAYNCILDVYIDQIPEAFTVDGKSYNTKSFAESLPIDASDYISITSFTHHPFKSSFVLEIPDNYSNGSYHNVTLDELVEITDYTLQQGHTISWDGDVSEKSFSQKEGLAIMPVDLKRKDLFNNPGEELEATQELRQQMFEDYRSTDDHLMHLIGSATDQNGTKYYIIKNSWGEVGPYKGLLYMSESYFRLKTISITVNKKGIPKNAVSLNK